MQTTSVREYIAITVCANPNIMLHEKDARIQEILGKIKEHFTFYWNLTKEEWVANIFAVINANQYILFITMILLYFHPKA